LSFDLWAILVFGAAAFLYAILIRPAGRAWALLIGSLIAVYWLQTPLPIRFSDYILPTATIFLTVVSWWFSRRPDDPGQQETLPDDRRTLLIIAAMVVMMSFMRFVGSDLRLTPSRPPSPIAVIVGLLMAGFLFALMARVLAPRNQRRVLTGIILFLIILFVVLKTEFLAAGASPVWRSFTGQDIALASPADLAWIGFSFVAFRLIHTLRDRQTGILPVLSLREYVIYVIFFPSYTAGPIDRAERFAIDFRALPELVGLDSTRFGRGLGRILIGMFKKFVISDSLAQGLSLTTANAAQTDSTLGMWLLLYGYTLRIYFDFSGYTDIAIGIGILFGIELPENFNRPYLKTNITAFWQSWHMTLSGWVRFYIFSPLSRWLLRRNWRPSTTIIVLVSQLTTMVVMGLWHGITLNFFIWGLWHGAALFVHKIWSERTRKWFREVDKRPGLMRGWTGLSWFLTFNYVALGWVWFALPKTSQSLAVFGVLFGG
jgi:D-alanyl-lipoteichoic acid acyltransferase DltB (MBOAT superfamily)